MKSSTNYTHGRMKTCKRKNKRNRKDPSSSFHYYTLLVLVSFSPVFHPLSLDNIQYCTVRGLLYNSISIGTLLFISPQVELVLYSIILSYWKRKRQKIQSVDEWACISVVIKIKWIYVLLHLFCLCNEI